MKGIRMFWSIIKKCNFDKLLAGFILCYVTGAFIIMNTEPTITTFPDAMWYLFVAFTTIGFGDLEAMTHIGRIVTVIMVIYQIVLVAVFSGVIVSNYLEVIHRREKYTATVMLDKLSHLSELSKDELKEIEDKVKALK